LADQKGLSGERIRQIRQQLGGPKPTHPDRKRKTRQAMQWAKDNLEGLKGLTPVELRRKYGLSRHWQSGPLYSLLKPFLRDGGLKRKHPWGGMNFRLPNRDLERIWRLPPNQVSNHRLKKQRPPPTWRCKPGTGHLKVTGRRERQAYRRAVKAEERSAARYFAQA
jgi:hypothetical protein